MNAGRNCPRGKECKGLVIFYIDVIRHQKGDWIELRIELQPLHFFPMDNFCLLSVKNCKESSEA